MYPVSPEFIAELRHGAEIVTKGNLYYANELIYEDFPIRSGSITDDSNSLIRRRCSVQLEPAESWEDLVPGAGFQTNASTGTADYGLWPVGTECKLWQGIKFRDRSLGTEWVPLGTYRISKPSVSVGDDGGVSVSFEGYDLSRKISRARFKDAFNIVYGEPVTSAISKILRNQCSWLNDQSFDFSEAQALVSAASQLSSLFTPNLVFDRDDDPWKQASDLATASGLDLYIGLDDIIRLRPIPLLAGDQPVFYYDEGEDCILTSLDRDIDDEQGYNGVIVTGENSSNPVIIREEIWDTNPASPIYYDPLVPSNSVYGPNPYFLTSQYISSGYQALLAGIAQFFKLTGIVEAIQISAIPMFAHESMDLVHVKHDLSRVDGSFILESFTFGLGASGRLSGRMRARRLA
jgi:hypothetical protein